MRREGEEGEGRRGGGREILHIKFAYLGLWLSNGLNPPHAPIRSFEKDILMSQIRC